MDRIYRPDQEVLDARGIDMSVAEVVSLPTSEYAARLRRLNLQPQDAAFVKSLRRRIKNRMASQNSRRRTALHIRNLTDELRAVRASKGDILGERDKLAAKRARLAARLRSLRAYIAEKLKERGENTELPPETEPRVFPMNLRKGQNKQDLITDSNVFECRIDNLVERSVNHIYNKSEKCPVIPDDSKRESVSEKKKDAIQKRSSNIELERLNALLDSKTDEVLQNVRCRRKSLVEIFKLPPKDVCDGPKIVRAKCVSVDCEDAKDINVRKPRKRKEASQKRNGCIVHTSEVQYETCFTNRNVYLCAGGEMKGEVLNLSLRESPEQRQCDPQRRHHGRKQAVPRRITHLTDNDLVLDLKVKKGCD